MKQIKNNFKFSNDKDYNKEFLYELENKEEFDCALHNGFCLLVFCKVNMDDNKPMPDEPMPDSFWGKLIRFFCGNTFVKGNKWW